MYGSVKRQVRPNLVSRIRLDHFLFTYEVRFIPRFFVWLKCWVRWNETHTRGASMSSSNLSSLLGSSLSPPMHMCSGPPSRACPTGGAPLASEGVGHRSPSRRGCWRCSPCPRVDVATKHAPRSLAPSPPPLITLHLCL